MRKNIIIISNMETKEYFVSPKHDDFDLDGFVPVTHYFPITVGRNNEIDLNNGDDIISFFYAQDGYADISTREDIKNLLKTVK